VRYFIPVRLIKLGLFTTLATFPWLLGGATESEPPPKTDPSSQPSLKVINIKGLQFSKASQNSPAETVSPTRSLYDSNAVFLVQGLPFRTLNVFIPQHAISMKAIWGGRGASAIRVHSFTSFPPSGHELHLNPLGTGKFYVGATRQATTRAQRSGIYVGLFTVTVAYQ
jgi:hypothetical protein